MKNALAATAIVALSLFALGISAQTREIIANNPAHFVEVHKGIVEGASAEKASASSSSVPFTVWSSCKFCPPGQHAQIWFESHAQLDNVIVSVTEVYYGYMGATNPVYVRTISANGATETSPGYFSQIPIYQTKLVADDTLGGTQQFGRYDFIVVFSSDNEILQSVTLTVYSLMTPPGGETGAIIITSVTTKTEAGGAQSITAHGTFPKNKPMFFWMGALGYEGGFSAVASCNSSDGVTATCGSFGAPGPTQFRGGIVLMTGDGSYSSVLPDAFSF